MVTAQPRSFQVIFPLLSSWIGSQTRWTFNAPKVLGLELLFGSMQQHAQVVPVDAKLAANLVTIALVQKDGIQK
jgi:hypothetical protein